RPDRAARRGTRSRDGPRLPGRALPAGGARGRVREPRLRGGRAEPDTRPDRRRAERTHRIAPLGTGLGGFHRPLARPPGALDGWRHARDGAAGPGPAAPDRTVDDPAA